MYRKKSKEKRMKLVQTGRLKVTVRMWNRICWYPAAIIDSKELYSKQKASVPLKKLISLYFFYSEGRQQKNSRKKSKQKN